MPRPLGKPLSLCRNPPPCGDRVESGDFAESLQLGTVPDVEISPSPAMFHVEHRRMGSSMLGPYVSRGTRPS